MTSSHSVELVDSKTADFCTRCSTVFESVFPLRPHQRDGWGVGG
jgi:predicted Zn-dependent protease